MRLLNSLTEVKVYIDNEDGGIWTFKCLILHCRDRIWFPLISMTFLEATTRTWSHTKPYMFRQKLNFSFEMGKQ